MSPFWGWPAEGQAYPRRSINGPRARAVKTVRFT